MKRLFKPENFKIILAVLVLLLIIKTLWFVVEVLWLPSAGIDEATRKNTKALYYRVKLTPNQIEAPVVVEEKPTQVVVSSIDNIHLLALYSASDMTVVTVEYKGKTKILSRGDDIDGFMLTGAGMNYALFSKNAKTYKVMLATGKHSTKGSIKSVKTQPIKIEKKNTKPKKKLGEIADAGNHKIIDRSVIEHYTEHMDDIYKNVGVAEMKDGDKLKGFWITFVRKDSDFAKLGLRRDDVIKSINGQEINSYNTAFEMYKNMKNMNDVTLVIQRGKDEMELEYEIN